MFSKNRESGSAGCKGESWGTGGIIKFDTAPFSPRLVSMGNKR